MNANSTAINIDHKAACRAQSLVTKGVKIKPAKGVDTLVTKTLGVLQENGIYACVLFLKSRSSDEIELAVHITEEMVEFLWELNETLGFGWKDKPNCKKTEKLFSFLTDNVVGDLNRLLVLKESLERMMVYARYGAKAQAAEDKSRGEKNS